MIKRITRYTLLILTLLIVGVWIASNTRIHRNPIDCYFFAARAIEGNVLLIGGARYSQKTSTRVRPQDSARLLPPPLMRIEFAGFIWERAYPGYIAMIPIWMLFTPLALPTAAMWYRPLRNRWNRKADVGFPLEMKEEA